MRRQQFENWRNQQALQLRQRQAIIVEEQITGAGTTSQAPLIRR